MILLSMTIVLVVVSGVRMVRGLELSLVEEGELMMKLWSFVVAQYSSVGTGHRS